MASATSSDRSSGRIVKTTFLGLASLSLYILLFTNEKQLLEMSGQGKWNFILPIVIAFVFSYVHGTFTGEFWDTLGIKAKTKSG